MFSTPRATSSKSILLVSKHLKLRYRVAQQIQAFSSARVLQAASGAEGLNILCNQRANAVLFDVEQSIAQGIMFMTQIRNAHFNTPIIFLSGILAKEPTVIALRSGAIDLIEEPFESSVLRDALGRAFVVDDSDLTPQLYCLGLTSSRIHILAQVMRGLSNKEIATKRNISEQAVKYHMGVLFKKFAAANRTALGEKVWGLVNNTL